MSKYKFEIDKRLMGLNEYTKYNRTNKYAGAGAKSAILSSFETIKSSCLQVSQANLSIPVRFLQRKFPFIKTIFKP